MKPETEKGLRAASVETQKEIVKLLADIMAAEDFADPLFEVDSADGLTAQGQAIFNELSDDEEKEAEETDSTIDDSQLDRLHEAICENRKEDAIDILREISGDYFRTVPEQKHLFPGRYEPDAL